MPVSYRKVFLFGQTACKIPSDGKNALVLDFPLYLCNKRGESWLGPRFRLYSALRAVLLQSRWTTGSIVAK